MRGGGRDLVLLKRPGAGNLLVLIEVRGGDAGLEGCVAQLTFRATVPMRRTLLNIDDEWWLDQ